MQTMKKYKAAHGRRARRMNGLRQLPNEPSLHAGSFPEIVDDFAILAVEMRRQLNYAGVPAKKISILNAIVLEWMGLPGKDKVEWCRRGLLRLEEVAAKMDPSEAASLPSTRVTEIEIETEGPEGEKPAPKKSGRPKRPG